jgi:hypothetical protein
MDPAPAVYPMRIREHLGATVRDLLDGSGARMSQLAAERTNCEDSRLVGLQQRPLFIAERRERFIAVVGHQLSRLPCGACGGLPGPADGRVVVFRARRSAVRAARRAPLDLYLPHCVSFLPCWLRWSAAVTGDPATLVSLRLESAWQHPLAGSRMSNQCRNPCREVGHCQACCQAGEEAPLDHGDSPDRGTAEPIDHGQA